MRHFHFKTLDEMRRAAEGAGARMFVMYVLPLVAVAATVEAFITPAIIRLVT